MRDSRSIGALVLMAIWLAAGTAAGQTEADEPGIVAQPGRELRVSLAVTSGVTAFNGMGVGQSAEAPFVGGDIRLVWRRPGKRWGMGLRLTVLGGIEMRKSEASDREAGMINVELAYLIQIHGFWVSPGLSVARLKGEGLDETFAGIYPALNLSVGYDLPLGRHLALRFAASGSTLLVVNHGRVGGGLVVRI